MISDFSAGKVVGDSFKILLRHFLTIFTIAFICSIPSNAIVIRDAMKEEDPETVEEFTLQSARTQGRQFQQDAPLYLIILIASTLSSGAVAYVVYQSLRGKSASVAESLGVALRRFFPLLGVAVCSGLFMGVGLLLLVIPFFIFAAMLYVASPACIVEKQGVFASMRRSRELTRGYRWRVFVVMVGVNILMLIVAMVLGVAIAVGEAPVALLTAVQVLVQTFQMAWNATAAALAYYHLRSIKDSVDVEDVAAVFD